MIADKDVEKASKYAGMIDKMSKFRSLVCMLDVWEKLSVNVKVGGITDLEPDTGNEADFETMLNRTVKLVKHHKIEAFYCKSEKLMSLVKDHILLNYKKGFISGFENTMTFPNCGGYSSIYLSLVKLLPANYKLEKVT